MFNFKKASFKYTFMTKVPKQILNLAQICSNTPDFPPRWTIIPNLFAHAQQ